MAYRFTGLVCAVCIICVGVLVCGIAAGGYVPEAAAKGSAQATLIPLPADTPLPPPPPVEPPPTPTQAVGMNPPVSPTDPPIVEPSLTPLPPTIEPTATSTETPTPQPTPTVTPTETPTPQPTPTPTEETAEETTAEETPSADTQAASCSGDGIYLYRNSNYGGTCVKFTEADTDLGDDGFNDVASSIRFVGSYGSGKYIAILYRNTDYGGDWTAFGADDADFDDDVIGHDRASSIWIERVPSCSGDGIYLYEHTSYGGRCRKFLGSDDNLLDTAFNDLASSIRFVGSYRGEYKVTLYSHYGYNGEYWSIFYGDDDNLGNDRIGNDRASSIRIEKVPECSGDGIYLYEHTNYRGECMKFTQSDNILVDNDFNDVASSIRFVGGYRDKYVVTLYAQHDYTGKSTAFTDDDADFGDDAIGNDTATSILVERVRECSGDGVYLYEHTNYMGDCVKFAASDPNFADDGFDEIVSSIRFAGSYGDGRHSATLCEDAGYGGACSTFLVDDGDLRNDAVGNDRASSILVDETATETISGGVLLQGRGDHGGTQILLSEEQCPPSAPGTQHAVTDSAGRFSLDVPAGKYHCLQAVKSGYLTAQKTTPGGDLGTVTLPGGDVNDDEAIDILDVAFISRYYSSADPTADINADGVVNLLDLVMAANNYGRGGPVNWP